MIERLYFEKFLFLEMSSIDSSPSIKEDGLAQLSKINFV
jgi:hypothetical protein